MDDSGSTGVPACSRHSDGPDQPKEESGDDNRAEDGSPPDEDDLGDAQDESEYEGRDGDNVSWEELEPRGLGGELKPRRRIHQRIQQAICKVLPRNEAELIAHMYEAGDDIILHPDYQRDSRILLDAFCHSFLSKTWEEIMRMVPEGYFEKSSSYLPVEESISWIERILTFNGIEISSFVKSVHNVANKVLPKKNALLIIGKPNAGKTLICESIVNSFVMFETLSTFNGNSAFEFAPMLMKRAVLMNEPKVTDKTVEILKCILEGITVSIDAKYKSGQVLQRTPIFVATNENLTFYTTARSTNLAAFKARCFEYTLKPFEELIDCNGKLHPLSWLSLVDRYVE